MHQLFPSLVAAEQEITQRNKAAEARWSSMTVADLQTTSEGTVYMYVQVFIHVYMYTSVQGFPQPKRK